MNDTHWLTYEWHTLTHLWMRLDPFKSEVWLIYLCDMMRLHTRHISFEHDTWRNYVWHMTHLHLRHDSFTCETWFHFRGGEFQEIPGSILWCDAFTSETGFTSIFDMTYLCEAWLKYVWDMTHVKTRHDSCEDETWLMWRRDMTPLQIWSAGCQEILGGVQWCDPFTYETWRISKCGDEVVGLQHTATHCNTPQHTATHRNITQVMKMLVKTLYLIPGKMSGPPLNLLVRRVCVWEMTPETWLIYIWVMTLNLFVLHVCLWVI